jgi:hypothetical protein
MLYYLGSLIFGETWHRSLNILKIQSTSIFVSAFPQLENVASPNGYSLLSPFSLLSLERYKRQTHRQTGFRQEKQSKEKNLNLAYKYSLNGS